LVDLEEEKAIALFIQISAKSITNPGSISSPEIADSQTSEGVAIFLLIP
jgi:FtsZ-interacting cell division protein ZipA